MSGGGKGLLQASLAATTAPLDGESGGLRAQGPRRVWRAPPRGRRACSVLPCPYPAVAREDRGPGAAPGSRASRPPHPHPEWPCRVCAQIDPGPREPRSVLRHWCPRALPDADPLLRGDGGAAGEGGVSPAQLLGDGADGRSASLTRGSKFSSRFAPLSRVRGGSTALACEKGAQGQGTPAFPGDRAGGLPFAGHAWAQGRGASPLCLPPPRPAAPPGGQRGGLCPLSPPGGPPRDREVPCSAGRTHLVLLAALSRLPPVCLERKVREASASDQCPLGPGPTGGWGWRHRFGNSPDSSARGGGGREALSSRISTPRGRISREAWLLLLPLW